MLEKLRGVTVLPEYIQSEGVGALLDNLQQRANVTAVTTSPYVMAPTTEASGKREPPADADAGTVRLLDRPLWGRRELYVRTSPSFVARRELYAGLKYQPAAPDDLTREQGPLVAAFLNEARRRGLKTYLQIQAAIPPGYRVQFGGPDDDDQPRLPNGRVPAGRVANNASLESPHIIDYQRTLITDLCQAYPEIDGIRFDWPEYPPYSLDDVFVDFSAHVPAARDLRQEASAWYDRLHGQLTEEDLESWSDGRTPQHGLLPGWISADFVRRWHSTKASSTERLLRAFRDAMDAAGAAQMQVVAHAFPPPWNVHSGIDFQLLRNVVDGYCVKTYTMHWAMMLKFYVDQLSAANPHLTRPLLARTLAAALDIVEPELLSEAHSFRYPGPDEPHPFSLAAQQRKIAAAQHDAGETPVFALAHSYGPVDDFYSRLDAVYGASSSGIWVNRYAYLSDDKLAAMGELFRSSRQRP